MNSNKIFSLLKDQDYGVYRIIQRLLEVMYEKELSYHDVTLKVCISNVDREVLASSYVIVGTGCSVRIGLPPKYLSDLLVLDGKLREENAYVHRELYKWIQFLFGTDADNAYMIFLSMLEGLHSENRKHELSC